MTLASGRQRVQLAPEHPVPRFQVGEFLFRAGAGAGQPQRPRGDEGRELLHVGSLQQPEAEHLRHLFDGAVLLDDFLEGLCVARYLSDECDLAAGIAGEEIDIVCDEGQDTDSDRSSRDSTL